MFSEAIQAAICEVLIAHKEHQTYSLFGGHSPERLNRAMLALEKVCEHERHPQEVAKIA